jgi:transposase-like protein
LVLCQEPRTFAEYSSKGRIDNLGSFVDSLIEGKGGLFRGGMGNEAPLGLVIMKLEAIMPASTRCHYTEAYIAKAVRLVSQSGCPVAPIARELGILGHMLYRWIHEQRQVESQGRPRQVVRTRLKKRTWLKRGHEPLWKERDCLQRAEACFAGESQGDAARDDVWAGRPESDCSVYARILLSAIRVIYRETRETDGSPRIWAARINRGYGIGEHRIARLMRAEGIRAKTEKKWLVTTDSGTRGWWPRTLSTGSSRSSNPTGCGLGTQPRLDHGGRALSRRGAGSVLAHRDRLDDGPPADRGSRRAGLYHGADAPDTNGRARAPLGSRQPVCGTSRLAAAREHGSTTSLSRIDNWWEHARVERWFGTLKRELMYYQHNATRDEAHRTLRVYRGVLQLEASSLDLQFVLSGRVRGKDGCSVTRYP